MKTLKTIFIIIVVLFVFLLAGLFIFIKSFDVNKYLPQISQQAGKAVNRQVNIGHADLNLGLGGLSLELKNITVSDDPQYSRKNFLELEDAYVGLDLMALITKRQVSVTKVTLTSPKISIVRLANGTMNVQTMVPASSSPLTTTAAPQTPSAAPEGAKAMALPAVFVDSIVVSHAQLTYEDQNAQMPLHLGIPDANITINHFSLTAPFEFTINLNAFALKENNINVNGRCSLDLGNNAVSVSGLEVKTDLSQWDWEKLKAVSPSLGQLPLPQQLKGDVTVNVPQLNASAKGVQELSMQIKSNIGEGTVDAQVDLKGLSNIPTYTFQMKTKSVKIEDLMDQSKAPVVIKGAADVEFNGSGQGLDPQTMMPSLKGQGQLSLTNAEIDKLNILKTILDKLNFIPGLSGVIQDAIDTSLPANVKSQLDTDTTVLTKAEGKISVENKTITVQDSLVESGLFSIQSQGTVDFDMNTNIDVKTYLSSDLSAALTKKARPLQGLLDDQKRLYIPGKVTGKAPSVGFQPQMDYITKQVATTEGKEQISNQLQKVFKKNPGVANIFNSVFGGQTQGANSDGSSNSENQSNTDGQTQQDSSQKVIGSFLDKIIH